MVSRVNKLFFGFIIQFLILSNAYSQQDNMLLPKLHIPSSPEAAMIERFGDIPVSYYSGTANISVPLYTVKEGDIEIPITLSYHGSGIKVADEATWVGLGWDLSPGGAIIQEVRGKEDYLDNNLDMTVFPDEYLTFKAHLGPIGTGAFYSAFQTGDCLKMPVNGGTSCGTGDDASNILYRLMEGEGQPDIYSYNFNGYSGKFYINPETHEVVLMDIKSMIYFEKSSSGWKATTLDGTTFYFQAKETSSGIVKSEVKGITYKLSSVYMLNGRSVNFNYTDEYSASEIYNESYLFNDPQRKSALLDYTISNKKTLSSIVTTDATINFRLENREDIIFTSPNSSKRLQGIDVISNSSGKKIKSFNFGFSYFPYVVDGVRKNAAGLTDPYILSHLDGYGKRLKLDSLQEIGYDDNENAISDKPPYVFTYDESITMPVKNSFDVDFWGYYNGPLNSKTLLPNLDYFDYPHVEKYLDENYHVPNLIIFDYESANRYTNNALAGANMLKKLTYPTGGYTAFEYEPNTFSNIFIPVQSDPVFKSMDAKDNSNIPDGSTSVHFKLSKTVRLHFENSIYNGAGNPNHLPPLTATDMLGCYIKLYKFKMVSGVVVQNSLLNEWNLDGVTNAEFAASGKHWSEDVTIEFDPDPNPDFDYRLEAHFPNNLNNVSYGPAAGVESHLTFYDNTGVDTTESKQCGMRIKSIKNYSAEGALASHKLIKYYDGKLLDGFEPLQTILAERNTQSNGGGDGGYTTTNFHKRTSISSGDIAAGNVGYGKVEEIELADGGAVSRGKNVYFYFNQENLRRKGYPSSPNYQNGSILTHQIFDDAANKQIEKTYLYGSLSYPHYCYSGITITNHVFGETDWRDNNGLFTNDNRYVPVFDYKFSYGMYPLISEWWKLKKLTTTSYSNGTELVTEESYEYNTEGSVAITQTVNSRGQDLTTKYFYPTDHMSHPYNDDQMILIHNIGTPVITEKYNGTTLLTRERVFYGSPGNAPTLMPQYIFRQYGSGGPEDKMMTVDSYDDKGNILQYTSKDGIPVSIVWNTDKTLPIAKIENAAYADLLALPGGLGADFRTLLPAARVTTYTYKPLVGVLSITDANHRVNSYEYDDFNRLKLIKDQDGNILKKYEYQYHQ